MMKRKTLCEAVKEKVDEELRIRSIFVETKLSLDETRGEQCFKLSSTKFNTVPVIHSAIEVVSFGGKIDGDSFYLRVHASYEGNGVELFTLWGTFDDRCVYFKGDDQTTNLLTSFN